MLLLGLQVWLGRDETLHRCCGRALYFAQWRFNGMDMVG